MPIHCFDDLLRAAALQPLPQRMLFVFLKTSLPTESSAEEMQRYATGAGGALEAKFCADLRADEVKGFPSLVAEADQTSPDWDKVLIACMDDVAGDAPAKRQVEQALKTMVGRISSGGNLHGYLCFTRAGEPLQFV
jgi:hypothetical protein